MTAITLPRIGYAVRRLLRTLSDTTMAAQQPAPVEEPAGLYAVNELPALDVIEAAAVDYERAGELARRADRGKRAAKKILDRLPTGLYGAWLVERVPNAREVADLEQIRAIFKEHGLGQVPMKACAPSLKVTRTTAAPVGERSAELITA